MTTPILLPQRRSGVPPTMPMTAVLPARPSMPRVQPEPLTYQAYSVGHLPPLRPPAPRKASLAPRVAIAALAVAIVLLVAAAAIGAC